MPQILGKPADPKEYIYMYYKPEWGKFEDGVFVRNQKYKLYGDGRFYDVEKDVLEQNPMRLTTLQGEALAVGKMLREVLDQMPGLKSSSFCLF